MMKNPRFANENKAILIEQDDGIDIYLDRGDLYDSIMAGEYGEIAPFVAPEPVIEPAVPRIVSRFQARAALLNAGLLDQAETIISESDRITQIAWEDAQEFRRSSPMLISIAQQLGLSESDLDGLFVAAAKIEA